MCKQILRELPIAQGASRVPATSARGGEEWELRGGYMYYVADHSAAGPQHCAKLQLRQKHNKEYYIFRRKLGAGGC